MCTAKERLSSVIGQLGGDNHCTNLDELALTIQQCQGEIAAKVRDMQSPGSPGGRGVTYGEAKEYQDLVRETQRVMNASVFHAFLMAEQYEAEHGRGVA